MIGVDGHGDGADGRHGVGQRLLVSFGYEAVVFDVGHRLPAVVVTGLRVLWTGQEAPGVTGGGGLGGGASGEGGRGRSLTTEVYG